MILVVMDTPAVHVCHGLSSLSHDLNVVNMINIYLGEGSSWQTLHSNLISALYSCATEFPSLYI